jgi:hypothetical protein
VPDPRASWAGVGRFAGYLAGGALLSGTILYLLDATNALGVNNYKHAGPATTRSEAQYWVAEFAYRHHILWDMIARDTLFPVAFMALIVLALAVRAFVPAQLPDGQLMVAFFIVGGVISILNDLFYLSGSDYWRLTGWSHVPQVSMVAAGRSEQAIVALTRWPEAAGFVVLAAALDCLGNLCRSQAALPRQLAPAVYAEAALLVVIAVVGVSLQTPTAYNISSLITGALVGPFVAIWLGHHIGNQHEGMGIVQLLPGCPHLILVAQLCGGRSATKLDESRIRAVAKSQQLAVDPPKLPRLRKQPPSTAWREVRGLRECCERHPERRRPDWKR